MTSESKTTTFSNQPKLYSALVILFTTALASPLAGSILIAMNYSQIGSSLAAVISLVIGVVLQIIIIAISKDHFAWALIYSSQVGLGLFAQQVICKKQFDHFFEQGASRRSGWGALGIVILCCIAILLFQMIQVFYSPSGKYITRAAGHLYLRKYNDAIDDLTSFIQLNPKNSNAYYKRGIIYEQLNQYQRAIDDFSSATDLDSHYASAYCERGGSYFKLGQYQKAVQDCSKAIQLNPKLADAYYVRGKSHEALKKHDLAKNDNEQAIKLGYQQPDNKTIIRKWKG